MTNEQIRIAIAEKCGWVRLERSTGIITKYPVDTARSAKLWWLDSYGKVAYWVPNYPEDLNAMHEAEKTIKGEDQVKYYYELLLAVTGRYTRLETDFNFLHATAHQRSEAWCRTFELWKEDGK